MLKSLIFVVFLMGQYAFAQTDSGPDGTVVHIGNKNSLLSKNKSQKTYVVEFYCPVCFVPDCKIYFQIHLH